MKLRQNLQDCATRSAILAASLIIGVSLAPDPNTPGFLNSLGNMFTFRYDGQALTYMEGLARSPGSLLNPGNSTVHLANLTATGELRPDAQVSSEFADLVLQPRFASVYQSGGVSDTETVSGYLREGYIRAKPANDFSVVAGRDVITWGPAFFRSPSSPYYFNNARLDPIRELSGVDQARAIYSPSANWTFTGGDVFDSGHGLVSNNLYRNSQFLKVDYKGSDFLASLVLARLQAEQAFIGGYAQATVNDAILVYGEFGTASNRSALDFQTSSTNPAPFVSGVDSGRQATALIGGSYTFENGNSIYGEYLYNGYGYSGSQERQFFRQANAANTLAQLGGSLGGLGTQNIGYGATRAQDLLGQHYLYLQLQNSQTQGSTLWRVMAAQNLIDHSAQLSFYLEHNLTDRLSLFMLGVGNIGSHTSEFGALYRMSLMLGLKIFVF